MIQYRPIGNHHINAELSGSSIFCIFLFLALVTGFSLYTLTSGFDFFGESAEISAHFEQFIINHGKSYVSLNEREYRKSIFASNYRKIQQINKQQSDFKLAINKFADLTDDEFTKFYLTENPYPKDLDTEIDSYYKNAGPVEEEEIDWVKDKLVTNIKDQGLCGSCWTFGSISTVESRYAKVEGKLLRFSEQQLVDCCRTDNSQGCLGGQVEEALTCLKETGNALNSDYPYAGMDQYCQLAGKNTIKACEGYVKIEPNDGASIQKALKNHTMYVSVNSGAFVFRFYQSGIVTEGCPPEPLLHGVTLVGSGAENGKKFWKVRNSWGPNWGEAGYIRLLRNIDEKEPGMCGLQRHVVYPKYKEQQ